MAVLNVGRSREPNGDMAAHLGRVAVGLQQHLQEQHTLLERPHALASSRFFGSSAASRLSDADDGLPRQRTRTGAALPGTNSTRTAHFCPSGTRITALAQRPAFTGSRTQPSGRSARIQRI
jgi:hypothetical protein